MQDQRAPDILGSRPPASTADVSVPASTFSTLRRLSERERFRLRWRVVTYGLIVAITIVWAFISIVRNSASNSEDATLVTLAVIALFLAACLISIFYIKQPLRLFCNDCGKYIPSTIGWVCGYCDWENIQTCWYSFLNRCERCKASPRAYKCHHCGEFFYLDDTHDARRYASRIPNTLPGETPEQFRARHAREQEVRQAEMRRLEDAVKIRKLERQFEKVNGNPTPTDPVEQVVRGARSRLDLLRASIKERAKFLREKKRLIAEIQATTEFQELSAEEQQETVEQIEDDFANALREL